MGLAVDVLVAERPRVQPLHEEFEDGRARARQVHGVGGGFAEVVGRVQGGGEEGGGGAEEFAVEGEEGFGGADGDVDDGFEEVAGGDGGFGGWEGRRCRGGEVWGGGRHGFWVGFGGFDFGHRDLCKSAPGCVCAMGRFGYRS